MGVSPENPKKDHRRHLWFLALFLPRGGKGNILVKSSKEASTVMLVKYLCGRPSLRHQKRSVLDSQVKVLVGIHFCLLRRSAVRQLGRLISSPITCPSAVGIVSFELLPYMYLAAVLPVTKQPIGCSYCNTVTGVFHTNLTNSRRCHGKA